MVSRGHIYVLTLLALLLQGMIPQGFMPARSAGSMNARGATLEICTAAGLVTKHIPAKAGHGKAGTACPFAPVLAYGVAQALSLPAPARPAAAEARALAFLLLSSSPRPYFAQGPPLS
jgi:hypothetical protein